MDQIFDRFERLFKSWVTQESGKLGGNGSSGQTRRSGDPDLDSAMDELDDFLDRDRGAAEARERARAEEAARQRARTGAGTARPSGPDPRLAKAYETLGVAYGLPFDEVKAQYKKLLMKHHPDKHGGNAENMKKATEMSTRINAAYQMIETWSTTGKIPD
ncbi:MAG: J domain-containing protein [Spirochaetota bacterium]